MHYEGSQWNKRDWHPWEIWRVSAKQNRKSFRRMQRLGTN